MPTLSPPAAVAVPRPDFFVLGAQKSGTTWLWRNLAHHPGVSLGRKEIHYFGGVEHYRKGRDWYLRHFEGLDPRKRIGEASTTYLYDRLPFFHNPGHALVHADDLPSIPELVLREAPDARFVAILRDPVARAVSAYKHWMRRQFREQDGVSPRLGLTFAATERRKMRILEYGYYERHLAAWLRHVPRERLRVYLFEEDVVGAPERTFADLCRFLDLDPEVRPPLLRSRVYPTWSVTRSWLRYYADPLTRRALGSRAFGWIDAWDPLAARAITPADIAFLRDVYLPRRRALEEILERPLDAWRYGAARA